MELNQGWKFKHFDVGAERELDVASVDYADYFWLEAKVPGDVHTALKEKGIIENPFFGHNDVKCRWIEDKVWWYRLAFDYQEERAENDFLELTFDGLDTFATVFLNGRELGTTDNMFIAHTFDVTREIHQGKNVLAVKFDPVHDRVKEKEKDYWSGFSKDRMWARKAQANFGWDWGPRLVTVGIWQDVALKKHHRAKIENVFARTVSIAIDEAVLELSAEILNRFNQDSFTLEYHLTYGNEHYQTTVSDEAETNLTIPNPKLWWTHDLGEPHLYTLKVVLKSGDEMIDEKIEEIGIRTIELQQKDENGNAAFTFVLNGTKVFAKGANWIPIDSFIGSASDKRYEHLLKLSKEANMNMLRVWGGGIYEKEIFYRTCDRQGLLVWQDFMFSCAMYPDYNRDFMRNVETEISEVVKRLRNHPSIALWCGNNENDWQHEVLTAAGEITTPFYGEKIYHELIPHVLNHLDPSRFYWPSSPFGGSDHDSEEEGDRHNWQVWHGNKEPRQFGETPGVDYSVEGVSFKNYKKDHTKFSSEFGMHASANRSTLKRNIPEDKFYWNSDEMAYRNKDAYHEKGLLLMEGYTGLPQTIDEYIHFSMLTQAEGLKYGIEHYRRHKFETSGALVWQLNDCWPGTSWSLIDYDLLPKASYYYAKRFFDPVLLSADLDTDDYVHLHVTNDLQSTYEDDLCLMVYGLDGKVIDEQRLHVKIAANGAEKVKSVNTAKWLERYPKEQIYMRLVSESGQAPTNQYFLADQKNLQLTPSDIHYAADQRNGTITVKGNGFTRMVSLDIPQKELVFSDNFFDLLPGEERMISVVSLAGERICLDQLEITAINLKSVVKKSESLAVK